jgi:hypothetical protein
MRRTRTRVTAALIGLTAVAAMGLPAPATAAPAPAPWVQGDPVFTAPTKKPAELGVVYQGLWNFMSDAQRGKVLDGLRDAGVGWVKIDLGWISLQPNGPDQWSSGDMAAWDKHIREIRSRGLKILGLFNHAPKWASGTSNRNGRPKDPKQFATAAAYVAKRYDGKSVSPDLKIDAIELWNEPDLDQYWAQYPADTAVSSLANLIKAAGPAIKRVNPDIKVIVGGTSSVDTDWVNEFYKTPGVIGTYDALGEHPYQSPGDATPETYDPKWGQYYMKHLAALDSLMASKGDPAAIWATEFGWSTHSNTTSTAGWARGVTEAQQADYLLRAMPVMAAIPRVKAAFWYASVNTTSGATQFDNYGLLRNDYSRKPAYYALKCAASGICGPGTAGGTTSVPPTTAGTTLIPAGASWRYNDKGVDLAKDWRYSTYDHSAWAKAAAQLGYGDGDEKTVVSYGSNSSAKYITTYFRSTFDLASLSGVNGLRLSALVDDGAKVYLNGTEIWRYNLPTGTVDYRTLAPTAIAGATEKTWINVDLPASALKTGSNLVAVEVHQHAPWSSDLTFDLSLTTR